VGLDTTVFRVEGALSLRVRADTRQRLGRGEVPQAEPAYDAQIRPLKQLKKNRYPRVPDGKGDGNYDSG
jgi:hypothetical protein